jgi:hypothetical protein
MGDGPHFPMSVWDGIDPQVFRPRVAKLDQLCRNGHRFQGRGIHRQPAEADRTTPLSATQELRLADDFAFLACTTAGPEGVSAAAVQCLEQPSRLQITLAANSGIPDTTKQAFRILLNDLGKRASGDLSRRETFARCEKTIVPIHRNRILGRLGLVKAAGRRYVDISEKLTLLTRVAKEQSITAVETDNSLIKLLDLLHQAIKSVQSAVAHSDSEHGAIRIIFQAALQVVSVHGSSLEQLCSIEIQPNTYIGTRVVRELRALALYRRIFIDLVNIASQQRELFASIELNLPLLRSAPLGQHSQKTVHAELQILVHFELHSQHRPRVIRASKKPCFLCYSFLRAHGAYDVPQTHGEVYKNWTILDNINFTRTARKNIQSALHGVAADVAALTRGPTIARPNGIYQQTNQTVSKMLVGGATSLSASTVSTPPASLRNEIMASIAECPSAIVIPRGQPGVQAIPNAETDEEGDRRRDDPIGSTRANILSEDQSVLECMVSAQKPGHLHVRGMDLFLECDDNGASDGASAKVKVCIDTEGYSSFQDLAKVDTQELLAGHRILTGTSEKRQLRFLLENDGCIHVVDIVWSCSGVVKTSS